MKNQTKRKIENSLMTNIQPWGGSLSNPKLSTTSLSNRDSEDSLIRDSPRSLTENSLLDSPRKKSVTRSLSLKRFGKSSIEPPLSPKSKDDSAIETYTESTEKMYRKKRDKERREKERLERERSKAEREAKKAEKRLEKEMKRRLAQLSTNSSNEEGSTTPKLQMSTDRLRRSVPKVPTGVVVIAGGAIQKERSLAFSHQNVPPLLTREQATSSPLIARSRSKTETQEKSSSVNTSLSSLALEDYKEPKKRVSLMQKMAAGASSLSPRMFAAQLKDITISPRRESVDSQPFPGVRFHNDKNQ